MRIAALTQGREHMLRRRLGGRLLPDGESWLERFEKALAATR